MWQAESFVGMEEFVAQLPCVLCVGTEGRWCHALLLSLLYRLALAIPK